MQKRNEPLENLQTQLEEITASLLEEKSERQNLEKDYKDFLEAKDNQKADFDANLNELNQKYEL